MIRRAAFLLAMVLAAAPMPSPAAAGSAEAPPPEPDGYRMEQFRAPVPATLAGATVLDTAAAHALWEAGEVLFIDVLPSPPKPANLPAGTLWIAPRRITIRGAVWLTNVGFGKLAPEIDHYFRNNLMRLTRANPARPVVFFCRAECWMSWNAARRAVSEYGLSQVYWYPDGTDGWTAAGRPTIEVRAKE